MDTSSGLVSVGDCLYLVVCRRYAVAIHLSGATGVRYSGRDLFCTDQLAPGPLEGDRSRRGNTYLCPQPGENIRLAGTLQPPMEQRTAYPPASGTGQQVPFPERLCECDLAIRNAALRNLFHLVLYRQPAVDIPAVVCHLCYDPLPVAESTGVSVFPFCRE